jgi:hypothetical protein
MADVRKSFIFEIIIHHRYLMSFDGEVQATLKEAAEHERKYEWLKAAECYEKALRHDLGFPVSAEIRERTGFCYSLASRQSEKVEGFRKLRQSAVDAYKASAELFRKGDDWKSKGKSAQCDAVAKYLGSWVAADLREKREMLDDCVRLARKGLEAYERAVDKLDYGKTCSDALSSLFERLYIASDYKEMTDVAQEGLDFARRAVTVLSVLEDKSELVRAYSMAGLEGWYAANIIEDEAKREEIAKTSLDHSKKAVELSKEIDNPYYAAMSNWAAGFCTLLFEGDVESARKYADEMMEQGATTRDNYLRGIAGYVLAFVTNWMVVREGDVDKKREGHKRIIKYAEDAIACLQLVCQDYFIAETYNYYAESFSSFARDVEARSEERRATLRKAVELGRKGLEWAIVSGSPDATIATLHALSKALHFSANLEAGKEEKKKLLQEALSYRQQADKIAEKVYSANDWVRGVQKNYEGLIESDLARLETSEKKALLESAVSNMEDGVSRCRKWIMSRSAPTYIAAVGSFEDGFGGTLNELYLSDRDEKTLRRAVEVYENAAKDFKRINLPSRAAESYWRAARNQDILGIQSKAAESFETAFAEYELAAQAIPNFSDFYMDYANYMKAWSGIEKAKSAHEREEHADAMHAYREVASVLEQTRLWSYFSSDFVAWSMLEQAEDLSRREDSAESIEIFKKAAALFEDSRKSFEEQIERIQNQDEKEKAVELSKASVTRKDYCLARVDVEEARISEKKGSYAESAEKYDSAASRFERMLETMDDSGQREMRPIAYMCRAWQKMEMAEGKMAPELYHEASELFLKAKEPGARDKTALLASGNSAFCLALEHGTRFEGTREKEDFSRAKQYLGNAASHYLRAGFDRASVWTSAIETLFDAYNYMITAEMEDEPEKKMRSYLLAERCLERSAKLYESAEYVGKRDEVLRILEKVKEKREFALSLGKLLEAPNEASSTRLISAPKLTVEEPVGLSKFEHESIQANLIARQLELVVGEEWKLEIHLANLGKTPAFLTRVEQIIPEGFELTEKPEHCIAGEDFLALKGRKLAPLEAVEMKLTLKSKKKGKFTMAPKIQFTDERGESKFCALEQVAVNVKELGIRGWLKGQG